MGRDPKIDFSDIQGLARFGHGGLKDVVFMLLDIISAEAARAWILNAPISTAERQSPPPDRALQIAFSAPGLSAIGMPDDVLEQFSPEFLSGMAGEESRSRRLGDIGVNAPEHWDWGGDRPPHVILLIYARAGELASFEETLMTDSFRVGFREIRRLHTDDIGPIEPFGFVDGISQPKIDWDQEAPTSRHDRLAYANHLAPGEILLGYENEYAEFPPCPGQGSNKDQDGKAGAVGRNGSYLVLRQLQQDVRGFWQFLDAAADQDPAERERLATLMVGRHRDGTALLPDQPGIAGGRKGNDFTFDDDPDGLICPIGAHIRRANPRNGDHPPGVRGLVRQLISTLGFWKRRDGKAGRHDLVASTRFHRLLRRGRPYGTALSVDAALESGPEEARGLHFICLCSNLVRQFEFVQAAWIANPKFNALESETDPLMGVRKTLTNGMTTDRFNYPTTDGSQRCLRSLPNFVTLKGGAYFFMPGIAALQGFTNFSQTGDP